MKRNAQVEGMPVTMIFDELKFIIKDRSGQTMLDIPAEYVRPILGLVSVMIDDEVPALLEKTYVNQDEAWELIWNVNLKPDKIFSGNWGPEEA